MRLLILNSIVANEFSYSPGDKVTISDADGLRLINGGFALRLIESSTFHDAIEAAAEAADFEVMPSGTAPIPSPSGGVYWGDDDRLYVVHPSGGRAILDPLHLVPGWSL